MTGCLRFFVIAVMLGASVAAAQSLPFEGRWATRADLCARGRTSPPETGTLITLTARQLKSPVMNCRFRSVLPGGMSFRIEASCEALGQRGEEFFTVAVLDRRLHWTWAGKTGIFERCPD